MVSSNSKTLEMSCEIFIDWSLGVTLAYLHSEAPTTQQNGADLAEVARQLEPISMRGDDIALQERAEGKRHSAT